MYYFCQCSCGSEFGLDCNPNSVEIQRLRKWISNHEHQINFSFLFQKHSKWQKFVIWNQTLKFPNIKLLTLDFYIAKVFDPSLWLIFPLYYIFFLPLKFQSSKKIYLHPINSSSIFAFGFDKNFRPLYYSLPPYSFSWVDIM